MKTLKDLTPEIISKIPKYQKKAIEGIFNGERYKNFDIEKAKKAIKWNYEKCGYKMPVVLVAENPLEQQLMFNYLNLNIKYYSRILYVLNNDKIVIKLFEKDVTISSYFILFYNFNIDNQLDNQLHNQLRSQLYSQLDNQLYSQLHNQLHNQLYNQLRSQLDNQLRSRLGKYNYNYLFTLNIYSDCYYTWFKFIKEEFNLNLTINTDFEECFKLQKESGIYNAIFSKEVCIISKYPVKIHQETSGQFRLNSITGKAVEWSNSFIPFDCYYINGVNITKELFDKLSKKEYTFEEWVKEENEEVKSAVLGFYEEKFGNEFVFRFLSKNLKEVDTFVDKKDEKYLKGTTKGMNIGVYTLFKGNIGETEIAYVRCYCPSTDRMFFLGVDPRNNNAKDAIASLCRVPVSLKNEIKDISRQGERYSFTWTKKGKQIKEKLTKKDWQNTASLDGNTYFSKLTYEY